MTEKQKARRASLNSNDIIERHMAQDLAFVEAVAAMEKTKKAELTADEAEIIRDMMQYANK